MKRLLLFAGVLLACLAFAANVINITDTYVFQALFRPWTRTTTQLPAATNYAGYIAYDTTKNTAVVADGTAWRSATPMMGATTYDFQALGSLEGNVTCAESSAITVPGALLTDGCDPSSNLGVDGGAGLLTEAWLSCRVSAAGAAKVKLCVQFTDGGSYNLGDAGFYVRVTH